MNLLRRITNNQEVDAKQAQLLRVKKQLKKGFVVTAEKETYYDGEEVRGKVWCNYKKLLEASKIMEVQLSFRVIEQYQVVVNQNGTSNTKLLFLFLIYLELCWNW